MPPVVKLISASWCKRCHELKPDIERICALAGLPLLTVDFDELEEDDELKLAVVALPTLLLRKNKDSVWQAYTPSMFEAWRADVVAAALEFTDVTTDF
jgi:thiol-disulfide isomerase/thioredoxin